MFDPTKPVQYRDGTPARILCTDAPKSYPIISMCPEGGIYHHTKDGNCFSHIVNQRDLINKPVKRREVTGWFNLNEGLREIKFFRTKEEADTERRGLYRIACVKITFTEGDGLLPNDFHSDEKWQERNGPLTATPEVKPDVTSAWQPMETAPKDRWIRLVYPPLERSANWCSQCPGWHFGDSNELELSPVGWRELRDDEQ